MFSKGQRVVCVDDEFPASARRLFTQLPRKGSVYTVRAVYVGRGRLRPVLGSTDEGEIGILLEELKNPRDPTLKQGLDGELGFKSDRFAPLEEAAFPDAEESVGKEDEILIEA